MERDRTVIPKDSLSMVVSLQSDPVVGYSQSISRCGTLKEFHGQQYDTEMSHFICDAGGLVDPLDNALVGLYWWFAPYPLEMQNAAAMIKKLRPGIARLADRSDPVTARRYGLSRPERDWTFELFWRYSPEAIGIQAELDYGQYAFYYTPGFELRFRNEQDWEAPAALGIFNVPLILNIISDIAERTVTLPDSIGFRQVPMTLASH